ncbi:hypothetical protein [Legionella fairfieldensis]|uniref:hypothetical protein n=1 Tax=Legionella fairfieldensis TaxID=45064 RepID=UPI001041B15B|nr:hypothetical protein [Legionella fairfieldensis]
MFFAQDNWFNLFLIRYIPFTDLLNGLGRTNKSIHFKTLNFLFEQQSQDALFYQKRQLSFLIKNYEDYPIHLAPQIEHWMYNGVLSASDRINALNYLAKEAGAVFSIRPVYFEQILNQLCKADLSIRSLPLINFINATFLLYTPEQLKTLAAHVNFGLNESRYGCEQRLYPAALQFVNNFVSYFEMRQVETILDKLHENESYFNNFTGYFCKSARLIAPAVYSRLTKKAQQNDEVIFNELIKTYFKNSSHPFTLEKIDFLLPLLPENEFRRILVELLGNKKEIYYSKETIILLGHFIPRLKFNDLNDVWPTIFYYFETNREKSATKLLLQTFGSQLDYEALQKLWPLSQYNSPFFSMPEEAKWLCQWKLTLFIPFLSKEVIQNLYEQLALQSIPDKDGLINHYFIMKRIFLPHLSKKQLENDLLYIKNKLTETSYEFQIYYFLESLLPRLNYKKVLDLTKLLIANFCYLSANICKEWYLKVMRTVLPLYINHLKEDDLKKILTDLIKKKPVSFPNHFSYYSLEEGWLFLNVDLFALIADTRHIHLLGNFSAYLINGLHKVSGIKREFSYKSIGPHITSQKIVAVFEKILPHFTQHKIKEFLFLILCQKNSKIYEYFLKIEKEQRVENTISKELIDFFEKNTKPFLSLLKCFKSFMTNQQQDLIIRQVQIYTQNTPLYHEEFISFLIGFSGKIENNGYYSFFSARMYLSLLEDLKKAINLKHTPKSLQIFQQELKNIVDQLKQDNNSIISRVHRLILNNFNLFLSDISDDNFNYFKKKCLKFLEKFCQKYNKNSYLLRYLNQIANSIKKGFNYPPSPTYCSFFNRRYNTIKKQLDIIENDWPVEERKPKLN